MPIQRRNIIGVDIGAAAVKLVKNTGVSGWRAGMALIPEGVMSGGQILSQKLLVVAVKRAMNAGRISPGHASLCLTGADVIIRQAVMPKMSAEQLKQNVIDEISGYLAVDPELYSIDYKVQEMLSEGSAQQYRVMIVAAPKSLIGPYVEALAQAGLKVVSVDVAANAREKLIRYFVARPSNFGVIDLGMNASAIDTYAQGRFFVSKVSASGIHGAAVALAAVAKVDSIRALDMILGMDPDPRCRTALADWMEQVAGDAERVMDYFRSRNQNAPLEQFYLCGGGARIPGAARFLQERLGVPVRDMSALLSGVVSSRIEVGPRLSAYAAAAGATLTEVG